MTVSGIITFLIFLQLLNADSPISFTPSSIIIVSNVLLYENAFAPIFSTLPGIITVFTPSIPEKAPSAIDVTISGIIIVSSFCSAKFKSDDSNSPSSVISYGITYIPMFCAAFISFLSVEIIYNFPFIIINLLNSFSFKSFITVCIVPSSSSGFVLYSRLVFPADKLFPSKLLFSINLLFLYNSTSSLYAENSVSSFAKVEFVIIPSSPVSIDIATPAIINNTTIVTTNAINVIPSFFGFNSFVLILFFSPLFMYSFCI